MFGNYAKSELELMVGSNEEILWQGKPNKRGFILEGIFNPLLPLALVWLLFDSAFITAFISTDFSSNVQTGMPAIPIFIIAFFYFI